MPVDPKEFDRAMELIRKEYGEHAIHTGSNNPPVSRISFGSSALDYATGGGLPKGRFSRFYGAYSSGKTLAALNVIREAQRQGLKCAYYNIEKQFDPDHFAGRDIDLDELEVIEGTTIEQV